jgi:predicted HTH domain antitoxin
MDENMKLSFACQMFKDRRLPLWQAAQLCGMGKFAFAGVLTKNKIPVIDYSVEELDQEVAMMAQMLP